MHNIPTEDIGIVDVGLTFSFLGYRQHSLQVSLDMNLNLTNPLAASHHPREKTRGLIIF